MAPSTQKQWTTTGKGSFHDTLKLNSSAPVPSVGDNEVLVRFHGASLNYRDLIIPAGKYPFAQRDGVVPLSDGAGVVSAIGSKVSLFKEGDKVVTLFNQSHLAGPIDAKALRSGVGGVVDGAAQQYGVYDQYGLVRAPENLDFLEASTLSCAGLTAWNALYGVGGKVLKAGDWVLTQGTGGVSVFAVQFAKAAGARVIATTSSKEKGERLKQLGADHVINYREDTNWGETAKKLTGGLGVDHIIEVGGPNTLNNSLAAVKLEGVITIIGFLGGFKAESQPTMLDALTRICHVRGVLVGSRQQFEEMIRSVEANDIHPVVDKEVFSFENIKDAYQYASDQKHFGKVCIKIE
ncbi:NAD(P)-binding protein [Myriangium duriaei CBS 260.36]|uniref:NAD(P)-binding protein n=1 Tax=Myriangium duriaei CBS 260.36 TaxID=1168546 RepID=A0A9P4IYV5_9PEZI|nr:NAD(P)-binding protein [Myriangium duriaei CBS 260.36]